MNKKNIIPVVVLILLILVGVGAFFAFGRGGKKEETAKKKPPVNEPVNVIDLSQRPYISLVPRADGKELTFNLSTLPMSATELEYELEYQAGTLLQGAFGSVDFSTEKPPISKKILLGSCSAGGACSFHEDVQGGTITLKFRGEPNYALKDEWRFLPTKGAKGEFASRDSKFQISAGKTLDSSAFLIVMQTSGLPKEAPGEVVAGPYGIYPSSGLPTSGELDISMRLSAESQTATIYGWDGSQWVEFETSLEEKVASAPVTPLSVFIAVK